MIKVVTTTKDGRALVLLGLSRENCKRLLEDKPIMFDGAEIGLPLLQFAIIGGETEETMKKQLFDEQTGFRKPGSS